MPTLSIILPVYLTEPHILPIYQRLSAACTSISGLSAYEIIFVDDGSKDSSWSLLASLAQQDARVKAIKLSRNFGQHNALSVGIAKSSGDWIVIMDCDLQHRPEDISRLWDKALEGYDVVNARRAIREDSLWKRCASTIYFTVLRKATGLPYDPSVGNFRIFNRKVATALGQMQESTKSIGVQIQWLGFATAYIDVVQPRRTTDKSAYSIKRLIFMAVTTIISFSNKPLFFSIILGITMVLAVMFTTVLGLTQKAIYGITISDWSSLMLTIVGCTGLVILNLGIIGIYLARIYEESKRRPVGVIAEQLNLERELARSLREERFILKSTEN